MRILFIIMFVLLAGIANFELKMLAEINLTEMESQFLDAGCTSEILVEKLCFGTL